MQRSLNRSQCIMAKRDINKVQTSPIRCTLTTVSLLAHEIVGVDAFRQIFVDSSGRENVLRFENSV